MTDLSAPLIFISYRNNDTSGETGRMADHLKTVIDKQYFFLDIESLGKGEIFPPLLKKSIEQCEVFIAVIGPCWIERLKMNEDSGAIDYVRMELAMALKKKKRILPVLVKDAKMPSASQLPKDLKGFDQYNATGLSYTSWEYDMERIVQTLKKYGIPLKQETIRSEKKIFGISLGIIAVVLLLFIGLKEFVFKKEPDKAIVPAYRRDVPALVAGLWRPMEAVKRDITYKLSQTSKQVTVEVFNSGIRTQTGYGSLSGNILSLDIHDQGKGNRSLTLELSTDHTKLIGTQSLKFKASQRNIGIAVTWEKVSL